MTRPSDDEAAIARLLVEHHIASVNNSHAECNCGWYLEPTPKPDEYALLVAHRAHVAAVLAAHMADREAGAWDAGAKHRNDALGFADNGSCFKHCNPFRLTPDTEGDD